MEPSFGSYMDVTVALVLAAGVGTRMRSRTPKVLHRIAGETMLYHVITSSAQVCDAVVVVVGHAAKQVQEEIERISKIISIPIYCAFQENPLGTADATAHGVRAAIAAHLNPQQFLITYSDVPLLNKSTLLELLEAHHASESTVTIATFISPNPHGYGRILRTTDGYVHKIVEHKEATPQEKAIKEVNSGVYVIDAPFLEKYLPQISYAEHIGERYLTDIVELTVQAGRVVTGHLINDSKQLIGCNNQHELLAARQEFNRRIIDNHLSNGVQIDDPATTWIDSTVHIDADAVILPATRIHGSSHIHSRVVLGPDTQIENSTVGEGSTVHRSEVIDSVIGTNCTIGPFSFLRAGTVLEHNVKIGAYVETKNTHIGEKTKVPHLSYVGDATVGEDTNIGAGTIVVNYDGETKYRSHIGNHVRIGSNSSIISPVTIGDGAYTGADSVINQDIPPGALAISHGNKQRTILNWIFRKRAGTKSAHAALTAQNNASTTIDTYPQSNNASPRSKTEKISSLFTSRLLSADNSAESSSTEANTNPSSLSQPSHSESLTYQENGE